MAYEADCNVSEFGELRPERRRHVGIRQEQGPGSYVGMVHTDPPFQVLELQSRVRDLSEGCPLKSQGTPILWPLREPRLCIPEPSMWEAAQG